MQSFVAMVESVGCWPPICRLSNSPSWSSIMIPLDWRKLKRLVSRWYPGMPVQTRRYFLLLAGIKRAKYLASVLPNDAINVFITLTARDLNSNLEIIARAECPTTERKLLRSGADHVLMPAAIDALRMAQIISDNREMLLLANDIEHLNGPIQCLHLKLANHHLRRLLSIRCVLPVKSFNFYISTSRYPRGNALQVHKTPAASHGSR